MRGLTCQGVLCLVLETTIPISCTIISANTLWAQDHFWDVLKLVENTSMFFLDSETLKCSGSMKYESMKYEKLLG